MWCGEVQDLWMAFDLLGMGLESVGNFRGGTDIY